MEYRKFGQCNFKVSALGFGTMRLPYFSDPSNIDTVEAVKMIRFAIDKGVNYVDTAYPYHSGLSEIVVGEALKNGYREKVKLATKSPTWLINEYSDFEKYLDEQLKKLNTDHIDMYLLHALDNTRWKKLKKLGYDKFLDYAIASGKIRYAGFSFHDNLDTFKEIVDSYHWSFCQIQYNYIDENYQAGVAGLKYAYSKGLGVVIMEPVKGGKLADLPIDVENILNASDAKLSPVELALKWVWDQKEVSLLLSGMSTFQQVIQNISYAEKSSVNCFSTQNRELIKEMKTKYNKLIKIGCTRCNYCMPCPNGVDIPGNFSVYNDAHLSNSVENGKVNYQKIDASKRASACIECGKCEQVCPQHLSIKKWLKEIDNSLSK